MYLEEVRKVRALPPGARSPRLLWSQIGLRRFAEHWERIGDDGLALGPIADHVDETADPARSALDQCTGNTLVHLDLRDDNLLIGEVVGDWPAARRAWI